MRVGGGRRPRAVLLHCQPRQASAGTVEAGQGSMGRQTRAQDAPRPRIRKRSG